MMKKLDRESKAWRQFVAWLAGSVVMPVTAYSFIADSIRPSDLDLPIVLIFGVCWGICSFVLSLYVKSNIH